MVFAVRHPLPTAVLVSGLIHLFLLGGAEPWWHLPQAELNFPIEASLTTGAPAAPPAAAEPARRARATSKPLPPSVPVPAAPVTQAAVPTPIEPPPAVVAPTPPPPEVVVPEPLPPPQPSATPVTEALQPVKPPMRTAVRTLPERFKINYAVQMGDDGFVAGRATYIWHSRDGRYSLVNTVEATGLASLFMSGRIVQLSEGEVDGSGLRPQQYWLQRNQRKQDTARFDWGLDQLTLGGSQQGVPLSPQAQDLLSFPFHLALTARDGEAEFNMGVTNGRRFREYTFRSLGMERLALPEREVEVLHLQGRREGEGTLDVWLDPQKGGLPVRIKTLDTKGKVFVLEAETGPTSAAP
jgi:hypothetical protein